MAKPRLFTAYNPTTKSHHQIPSPPTKLTTHRLRKEEWTITKPKPPPKPRSRKSKPPTKPIRKPSDLLTYNLPEYQCLHCARSGDDPLCTLKCHKAFTTHHLDPITSHITIHGPDARLGYSAHLSPTAPPIPKGTWIGEYIGELRPLTLSRTQTSRYWVEIPGVCAIDPERAGNWTRFMNSCCRPNVRLYGEFVGKRRVVGFVTAREVKGGEELCFDYGGRYWERLGVECECWVCKEERGGGEKGEQVGGGEEVRGVKSKGKKTACKSSRAE